MAPVQVTYRTKEYMIREDLPSKQDLLNNKPISK